MNVRTRSLCVALLSVVGAAVLAPPLWAGPTPPESPMTLWYQRPAAQWVEALPVGNGRIGAMVFGGIEQERIQLNEDTLWAGGPYDPSHADARAALPEIRRLLAASDYAAAHKLAAERFLARPMREMPYQTVGDLLITVAGGDVATGYRRSLDLDTAIARTSYTMNSVVYEREVFVSPVDQVVVIRLAAHDAAGRPDRRGRLSFALAAQTPMRAAVRTEQPDTLVLHGVNGAANGIAGALQFEARARVTHDGGTLTADGGQIRVEGADSALIVLAMATSYRRFDDVGGDPTALTTKAIAAVSGKPLEAVRAAHVAEHQRLFRRVSFELGTSGAPDLPTDERVRRFADGKDPQLAALYFQFGRYLLISSSRPGGQPANLQGLWNDSTNPPWGSKYTININTEMNYWPAEVTNLAECVEPLVAMIGDLAVTGARTARTHYGASGWVAHHNTDLWRATGPIDGAQYGVWPTGGAWLVTHLWEHYRFSGDTAFLARVYPIMKGAAEFFLDTLVSEPTHNWLVTSPSLSPENTHRPGVAIVAGPTMDSQIVRDLFTQCAEASRVLGIDEPFRKRLLETASRLAPSRIGKDGQLMEWLEDWDATAPDPHHRHVSHLYGFFPSAQITMRGTPDLAAAVKQSLVTRGDQATGWATAWRLALWARLLDGDHAYSILSFLLSPARTYPNLFDAHPPFQIDGNLGGTAGMAEMLLQSHAGEIELLPAMPTAWPDGRITGLRARGGFEVDLTWAGGRLTTATIRSMGGGTAVLRYGTVTRRVTVAPGSSVTWDGIGG
jgi:alpha-L-fucosidase 2